MDYKQVIKNHRLMLLFILIIASFVAIHPNFNARGVVITSARDPAPSEVSGQLLVSMNGAAINSVQDFATASENLKEGDAVRLTVLKEKFPFTYQSEEIYPFLATQKNNSTYLGLQVKALDASKVTFGIELSGGTKLILKPAENITSVEYDNVLDILRRRLDLFGVKGAVITTVTDLKGEKFIQVELASVTNEQAVDLISKEGKFEAKIANQTVFNGLDIIDVCLSSGAQCAYRILPLDSGGGSVVWEFLFGISLSEKAANSFAEQTLLLGENGTGTNCYLNSTLDFFIDDELIDGASLGIPCDLKGKVITDPTITGRRATQEEAQSEMRYLQSILQSRSLPVKMQILSAESVSPVQGKLFIENVFFVFILSILIVDVVVALKYRDPKMVLITVFISLSEIFVTLGIAAGINWTLDIASIAGIIASVGTGISDQIIVLDEVQSGHKEESVKRRISTAFFVVIASYFVSVASMTPLFFAGAGLLRGFAVTTIIGISVGVLITRPAFAELIKMVKKN